MQWFQAGEDLTFEVELMAGGVQAQPDAGSVTYTVRDQSGAVLAGLDHAALDVPGTTAQILLPAHVNGITAGNDTETRFVFLAFKTSGQSRQQQVAYGLHPFIPMSADADAVRGLMGVSVDELPDEAIDLIPAYYSLRADYGTDFTNALVVGDSRTRSAANRALAARAAIDALPSFQLRLVQSKQVENSNFSRWDWVDLDKLKEDLTTQLGASLAQLSDTLARTVAVTPTIFVVSSPTDPVTG
ncbi:hypothetical protein DIE18_07095 [Burkholderia sp. Bp9125]|nr:hypothetical protein DIE18_07095 [Burkholderia sp. Bp9125]